MCVSFVTLNIQLRPTLLDTKLGNHDIERLVEDTDNSSRPDNGPVTLGEVGDEDAKEEVRRLLLSEASGVLLDVARLRDLGDSLGVESELGVLRYACEELVPLLRRRYGGRARDSLPRRTASSWR